MTIEAIAAIVVAYFVLHLAFSALGFALRIKPTPI
jgi:hypothetical protein